MPGKSQGSEQPRLNRPVLVRAGNLVREYASVVEKTGMFNFSPIVVIWC